MKCSEQQGSLQDGAFYKITDCKKLTIFAKNWILDVSQGFEYASDLTFTQVITKCGSFVLKIECLSVFNYCYFWGNEMQKETI